MKPLCFLFFLFVTIAVTAQKFEEGNFNNWDFGPNGTYGNLRLTNTSERWYYHLSKEGPQLAKTDLINPSGIVVSRTLIRYNNGILTEVKETDKWGEVIDVKNYSRIGPDLFKVTEYRKGVNAYMPCKYTTHLYVHDLLTEIRYYSNAGKLKESRDGYAIIRFKRYDDALLFAMTKEKAYFNVSDQPVISKADRYHKIVYECDTHDNDVSESYYGPNNQPISPTDCRQTKITRIFNENNQPTKIEFRNADNTIVSNVNGVAAIEFYYDHGYNVKSVRFDSANHITKALPTGDGISVFENEFDMSGNLIKKAYFDEKGNPMSDFSGVHQESNIYSAGNMLLEESYFDDFGNPSVNRDKIHTIKYARDSVGRIAQIAYYDASDKPQKSFTNQVYMEKYKYDEYGRKTEQSYWMDSITPMPRWSGEYKSQTKFDQDGNPVQYTKLDRNDLPYLSEDGSSVTNFIYNEEGVFVERQYLHNKKLILKTKGNTQKFSIIKYGFDETGKLTDLTFYGIKKEPVNAEIWIDDDQFNAFKIVFIYTGNRIVAQQFYAIDNPVPVRVIDCLKSNYIAPSGINLGRKNAY